MAWCEGGRGAHTNIEAFGMATFHPAAASPLTSSSARAR